MDDLTKKEEQLMTDNKSKPFNEIYERYTMCRENKEECDEKIVMSDVSKIYQDTRVEELPFLKRIEFFENITTTKPKELKFDYFVDKEETPNKTNPQKQNLTETTNHYSKILLTVLATTTIYYFFFKLSK
jgi:hypothetical protein